MIKKRAFLNLLLFKNFNNNIISMHSSNLINNVFDVNNSEQNSAFLALPEEIIQYVIQQLIDHKKLDTIIKKIKNTKNIFELYSLNLIIFEKELIGDLNNVRLTSHQLKDSAQYYIDKLRNEFKEKKQRLINEIKDKYPDYDKDKLNNELKTILNKDNLNRALLEEATKLIIAGADVNLQFKWGLTTLIWATYHGYKDIVKLLLNHKDINIHLKDDSSYTALMKATYYGHKDIVELLLNHKDINVNMQDNWGKTALMLATMNNYKDIVELLLNHKDININMQNNNGSTSLMIAAYYDHKDIVELLLNHKDINIYLKNIDGYTALKLAIERDHSDIIKLIKKQIDKKSNFCLVS